MMKYFLAAIVCASSLTACGTTIVPGGGVTSGATAFQFTGDILSTPPVVSTEDTNFASLLNNLRVDTGVGTVSHDARLDAAAQKHAQDMVDNDYFSHQSQDGRQPWDRVAAEGYDWAVIGENINSVQQTDEQTIASWQTSPSHDALMKRDDVEDFALGVAGVGSDTKWVLLMGREK